MAREYQWTPEIVDSIPDSLLRVYLCGPQTEVAVTEDPTPEELAAQIEAMTMMFGGRRG